LDNRIPLATASSAFAWVIERGRWIYVWGVAFLIAYMNYVAFIYAPLPLCVAPDSAGYLLFDVTRTDGYPLFLAAAQRGGWLSALPIMQLNLSLVSFAVLFGCLANVTGRWLLALCALLPLVANGHLLEFTAYMLTDSLYTSALVLHLATGTLVATNPSPSRGFLFGLSAAIVVLVRPAGYFLLVTLPIAWTLIGLAKRSIPLRSIAATTLAVVVPLLGAAGSHYVRYGDFAPQSIGGLSLLGHVLTLLPRVEQTRHQELVDSIRPKIYATLEDLPQDPFTDEYRAYTLDKFNTMLWTIAAPQLYPYANDSWPDANRVASEVAIDVVRAAPMAYAMHVLSHTIGLWNWLFARSPDWQGIRQNCQLNNASALDAFEDLVPTFRERTADLDRWLETAAAKSEFHWFEKVPRKLARHALFWELLGGLATLATLIGFASTVRRRRFDPVLFSALYCLISLWSYFFLVALVAPATPRYAVVASAPYWGGVYLFVCWSVPLIADFVRGHMRATGVRRHIDGHTHAQ